MNQLTSNCPCLKKKKPERGRERIHRSTKSNKIRYNLIKLLNHNVKCETIESNIV